MRPTLFKFAGGAPAFLALAAAHHARCLQACGDHSGVLTMHACDEDLSDLGRRFVECFVRAADDAGLPDDPEFRAALRDYMRWAVAEVLSHPTADIIPGWLPMPRWSWDGLQA